MIERRRRKREREFLFIFSFSPPSPSPSLAHLCADVLEGRGGDDAEADEEDVRLGVGERAQAVVVLLAGRVPQAEVNRLAVHHDVGRVVVKDGRDVLAREGVGRVGDEQARLAHGAVAHNHTLDGLHRKGRGGREREGRNTRERESEREERTNELGKGTQAQARAAAVAAVARSRGKVAAEGGGGAGRGPRAGQKAPQRGRRRGGGERGGALPSAKTGAAKHTDATCIGLRRTCVSVHPAEEKRRVSRGRLGYGYKRRSGPSPRPV